MWKTTVNKVALVGYLLSQRLSDKATWVPLRAGVRSFDSTWMLKYVLSPVISAWDGITLERGVFIGSFSNVRIWKVSQELFLLVLICFRNELWVQRMWASSRLRMLFNMRKYPIAKQLIKTWYWQAVRHCSKPHSWSILRGEHLTPHLQTFQQFCWMIIPLSSRTCR